MENETRNTRISSDDMSASSRVSQLFDEDIDIDLNTTDSSAASVQGASAGAGDIQSTGTGVENAAYQPRSARVAPGMRSGSSRVRSVDMDSFEAAPRRSSTGTGSSARSSGARSAASSRTNSGSRSASSSRTSSGSRTAASSRTSSGSRSTSSSRTSAGVRSSQTSRTSSAERTSASTRSSAERRASIGASSGSASKQVPAQRRQSAPAERKTKYTDVAASRERQGSGSRKPASKGKNTKKKGMSGFKKFLIVYSALLLVAIIVVSIVLNSFLVTYEKNQPTNVAAEVVAQFETSDKLRSFLEDYSGIVNQKTAVLNGEEAFISAVEGKKISYIEDTSNTTSEQTVYKLTADNIPVASITLVKGEKGAFGMSKWLLSDIDTSPAFSDAKTYSILVPEGSTVTINGTTLTENQISGTGIPEVLETSKDYIAAPPTYTTYNVKVVNDSIDVSGTDADGNNLVFSQSEDSFVAGGEASQEFIDSVKDRVEDCLKEYALYWIYQAFNLSDYVLDGCEMHAVIFGGTFDGETYDKIDPWLYNFEIIEDYSFSEFEATNYVKYSDDCFTVDVKYKLDMVFTDPTASDENQKIDATWVWVKNDGQWYLTSSKLHSN